MTNQTFTTIDTSAVTSEQIDNVYPLINQNVVPNQMFFQVETPDFDEENHRKVCNVGFVDGSFKGSCGDNCEHIAWVVAFIKEEKLQDYFDEVVTSTFEVLDRKELTFQAEIVIIKREYQVQDGSATRLVSIWPSISACSCGKAECEHIQAARTFETIHQAELADYHGC
jgi:hypothetical protein